MKNITINKIPVPNPNQVVTDNNTLTETIGYRDVQEAAPWVMSAGLFIPAITMRLESLARDFNNCSCQKLPKLEAA